MTTNLYKVLAYVVAIPIIGFIVSFLIMGDLDYRLETQGLPNAVQFCELVRSNYYDEASTVDLLDDCNEVTGIHLLGQASILAGIIGLFIPALNWIAAKFTGENRRRSALIFPILIRMSILLIAVVVLLQGGILVYTLYLGESYWIGRIHIYIILGIGISALLGGIRLITASMRFTSKLKATATGRVLNKHEAPQLFSFVHSLAKKLNAKPPNNIIVGLDPTFYVTSCDINILGSRNHIVGETLYLSAPLSRLLSTEEFAAVIGHELGHFRGEDTAYSMRFAPVYAGLGNALGSIIVDGDKGRHRLAKLPAIAILSYIYELFAINQAKISRIRELKADEVGAEAASPSILAAALTKVSLYSSFWHEIFDQNDELLDESTEVKNLSIFFQDRVRYKVEHDSLNEIINFVTANKIAHPTDSHPPIAVRLEALGVDLNGISKNMLSVPSQPAFMLIDNCEQIEEELTLIEDKSTLGSDLSGMMDEKSASKLMGAIYCLVAAMMSADGSIDEKGMQIAESIGSHFFRDFDTVKFRSYCNNIKPLSDAIKLAQTLGGTLEDKDKSLIVRYLNAVARADGNISLEQKKLLADIITAFGINGHSV